MGSLKASLYKDFKLIYSKSTFIIVILLLFLFIYVVLSLPYSQNIQNKSIKLFIINEDQETDFSANLINLFKNDTAFKVDYTNRTIDIMQIIQSSNYNAILLIPNGFSNNIKNLNNTQLTLYIISPDDYTSAIIYYTIRAKLNEYFKENLQISIVNEINNQTSGNYTKILTNLLNPVILDVNLILIKYQQSNETFYSYYIQSLLFSTIIISSLLTTNERRSELSGLIYNRSMKGIELLLSKYAFASLFSLITLFLFYSLSISLKIDADLYSMLIALPIVLPLGLGISLILACVTKRENLIISLEILALISLYLLTGLIASNFKPLSLEMPLIHSTIELMLVKDTARIVSSIGIALVIMLAGSALYALRISEMKKIRI